LLCAFEFLYRLPLFLKKSFMFDDSFLDQARSWSHHPRHRHHHLGRCGSGLHRTPQNRAAVFSFVCLKADRITSRGVERV
jgi:hypothetical protein